MVIISGILGGLCLILGLIYGWIYCTRLRPRNRLGWQDHRSPHYGHPENSGAQQGTSDTEDRPAIKAHPFFIMHYMKKVKDDNQPRSGPSGRR